MPDLRRDMAGVPEISVSQERVDVEYPGGTPSSQGSTVLGNPVSRDRNEQRPSARILRKGEKDHCSACEEGSPREDLEG
jgi:hypothetical protein